VRPEARELAGDLGEKLSAGEEKGKGREGADSPGPAVREREGRKRRAAGRKTAPTRGARMAEKEKKGKGALGRSWAGCWQAGPRRKEGERERRWAAGGKGWAEREVWAGLPSPFLSFSSFLFLFHTQTIQTTIFEFK
jgi:hypothetical protein